MRQSGDRTIGVQELTDINNARQGPLHGIRVLDLTRVLAGPWATQLLGDFGADVVKVERPGSGDDTRRWGPPWLGGDEGESAYFLSTNRNKRSITIDLKNADGCQVLRRLASKADVLIENFRAGTLAGIGLDYDVLRAENPGLVLCAISAYGRDSSKAAQPGYDAMIQASAGLMSITGAPDDEGGGPQKVGVAVADIMAGMYAATAIIAALRAREKTGKGDRIEVPLYDSQVAWLANQAMNYLVGGVVPERRGTAHPNIVPYQAFATADGHLMLAVGTDRQFDSCVSAIGAAALADDPAFATNAARVRHRDRLVDELGRVFRSRPTSHWLDVLSAADVPCGPINRLDDVFESGYVRERGLVQRLQHPLSPSLPTIANPVRFAEHVLDYRRPPPMLGQHSDEVLREWLGYSAESIQELKNAGAL